MFELFGAEIDWPVVVFFFFLIGTCGGVLAQVQKQLLLGCKIQCRSSLPFYSGCPYSFGLQHGMEEMMIDQTRDLYLEDDLVRILLNML